MFLIPVMPKNQDSAPHKIADKAKSIPTIQQVASNSKEKKTKDAQDIEEISGLIIEKTMTKIGYEFYEQFFSRWEAPEGISDYNIYINERASPIWGSLIYVNINDTLVLNMMLRPRSNDIEEAAVNSIGVVLNYLYQYEEIQKQQAEGGDMAGNGIY